LAEVSKYLKEHKESVLDEPTIFVGCSDQYFLLTTTTISTTTKTTQIAK
jgi:malic enzyme